MMDNTKLQKQILEELRWEPQVDAASIGVTVHDGVVTLSGHVNTALEKAAAEKAVRRMTQVHAIVNELDVRPPTQFIRDDAAIADVAVKALEWQPNVPGARVKVIVEGGWVRLEGDVDWQYQRLAAEKAIGRLTGVLGVVNHLTIKPRAQPKDIKHLIEQALRRSAELEAEHIDVEVKGSKVRLTGSVRTWLGKSRVHDAAWAAPGITEVDCHITVNPYMYV
jgi:osmotically-inducible protein OsmY